jgi:hypothetical protein
MPLPNSPNVNSRQLWRTQRQAERRAAWPGTVRHPVPPPPPRLYFLAGVTRGAYFYALYYFAFLECAIPGVNPLPQFGQCALTSKKLLGWCRKISTSYGKRRFWPQAQLICNTLCGVSEEMTMSPPHPPPPPKKAAVPGHLYQGGLQQYRLQLQVQPEGALRDNLKRAYNRFRPRLEEAVSPGDNFSH